MKDGPQLAETRRSVRDLARDPWLAAAIVAGPLVVLTLQQSGLASSQPASFTAWMSVASFILLYPCVEEVLFRGLIQPYALSFPSGRKVLWGVTSANVATSVLFAAAHGFAHSPDWSAAVFFPSISFGFFRDRYDGMAVPVGLHVFYNACYLFVLAGYGLSASTS